MGLKCEHCAGRLTAGRRSTIERTVEVHTETCPGLLRLKRAGKKTKDTDQEGQTS